MVARSPADWIAQNRFLAAGVAAAIVASMAGVALLRGDDDPLRDIADRAPGARGRTDGDADPGAAPGALAASAAPGRAGRSRATLGGGVAAGAFIPGTQPVPPCTRKHVTGTGITDDEIVVGQIVTDVAQLPQQLGPAREGLAAYLKLVNDNGGVCGRRLRLDSRNDQLNPAIHRSAYESLASSAFAFVANESLQETQDYAQSPPFTPAFKDGDEFVPDVGGLAFSYGRSQSAWHAGVVGSISPTLVGGGQFAHFTTEARRAGTPCRKAAIVYVTEPTGASEEQARLGEIALQRDWGGNLGTGNTKLYAANLLDPTPVYQSQVQRMIADGMNCVFSYTDIQSNINLVQALAGEEVWPPEGCTRGDECFRIVYVTLSSYDRKFITDGQEGARSVSTFIPHAPLNETANPVMAAYLDALRRSDDSARPSTFSVLGFASGQMFVEALQACGGGPTRACVMQHLRVIKDFSSGGLLGPVTPFRTTRATFAPYGTYDWKWIFNCTVALRVMDTGGRRDFHRLHPGDGYSCDTIKVARGTAG